MKYPWKRLVSLSRVMSHPYRSRGKQEQQATSPGRCHCPSASTGGCKSISNVRPHGRVSTHLLRLACPHSPSGGEKGPLQGEGWGYGEAHLHKSEELNAVQHSRAVRAGGDAPPQLIPRHQCTSTISSYLATSSCWDYSSFLSHTQISMHINYILIHTLMHTNCEPVC